MRKLRDANAGMLQEKQEAYNSALKVEGQKQILNRKTEL